ncbi:MAG: hypothetical protein ACI4ML_03985 [Aristaeellaceae bacterium]
MEERELCGCAASEEFLEDMPMRRYRNPIPTCESRPKPEHSPCVCREELEEILDALACQNQLMMDLLGAVNSLTAARLAQRDGT